MCHSSLPHGKDLHGEKLQEELEKVMGNFGSKAPKIRQYGTSESNDFRVACAVSQKNIGHTYVSEVRISVRCSND